MLKKWEQLPEWMRCPEVKEYYDILDKKRAGLLAKRIFDVIVAAILFAILAIPMLIIAIRIKLDSPGDVFYRQERITTNGQRFKIHKFRTMVANADKIGSHVTVGNDSRITKIGGFLRKYRLDELPQVIDVLQGTMSFVGTRPEAVKYVDSYTNEMKATLLLPAGITSEASVRYKDEAQLLDGVEDVDKVYIEQVLPGKMKYNLDSVREFGFFKELTTMGRTVLAVAGKEYK